MLEIERSLDRRRKVGNDQQTNQPNKQRNTYLDDYEIEKYKIGLQQE